jgi:hypothetical protein
MIPCLCTLYFNQIEYFVHKPWEASSYYLEHCFGLIIISLFNLFFRSFDRSLHLLIFDPQYSLIFLKYFPLYMCMCFNLFILDMHTVLEELSLLAF